MLKDRSVTEADREAIRTNLREGFSGLETNGTVHVPAEVHLFTATAA